MSTQQMALTSRELDSAYDNVELLQSLIDSKKLPTTIKTVQDAMLVRQQGRELGLTFMQAANVLFPVNGKLALTTQGMTSLLLSMGVSIQTIIDFEPMEIPVIVGDDVKTIKTYGTTIEFKRQFATGIQTERATFTWNDAKIAGLTSKETYKTYPKAMIWARCMSMGARRIAADILAGIGYIVEELETVNGKQQIIIDDIQIPEPIRESMKQFDKIAEAEPVIVAEVIEETNSDKN